MKRCVVPIVLLFISFFGYSQDAKLTALLNTASAKETNKIKNEVKKSNKNEYSLAFSGMFLFYKSFISSQDGQSCSFTPSCSEYSILYIRKYGVLKGGLATFDRLSRCNGSADYPKDVVTGLNYDPVK